MQIHQAKPLFSHSYALAEGPFYQSDTGILSWVDIINSALIEAKDGKIINRYTLGQYVGAAIPTNDGRYVVALTTGIYLFAPGQGLLRLCVPDSLGVNQRFNDAKCDDAGRLWAGTMRLFGKPEKPDSKLYRMDAHGNCITLRDGLGLANGIAFAPAIKTFYHIDTPTRKIDVFDYEPATGNLLQKRGEIAVEQGHPDGMTIDRDGMLWVALWGGSAIFRFDPQSGKVIAKVEVPTANVTSCCFAGEDLSSLIITTAAQTGDPKSGLIYTVKTESQGLPGQRFQA